jgi:hypothetical protein
MKTWYHGTSSEAGLEPGDILDPRRGGFEPAVWATSSPEAAARYAQDAAAVLGGDPVVYRVVLADHAEIVTCPDGDELDLAVSADAIIDERGEHGVPTLAILTRVAHVEDV